MTIKELKRTMDTMKMSKQEQLMAMLRITLGNIKKNDGDVFEVEYYFESEKVDKLMSLLK